MGGCCGWLQKRIRIGFPVALLVLRSVEDAVEVAILERFLGGGGVAVLVQDVVGGRLQILEFPFAGRRQELLLHGRPILLRG